MINKKLLHDYSDSIRTLRKQCLDAGMSEEEFQKLYLESLQSIDKNNKDKTTKKIYWFEFMIMLIVAVIVISIVYNYKILYSCLLCNLQEYIYPGLQMLRRIAIPFISLFPSLTDFYHETCLITNPFFTVVDMDCWPCSSVNNVREIYNPTKPINQHNAPFIYGSEQQVLDFNVLKEVYSKNKHIFDKYAPKIFTDQKYILTPDELFSQSNLDAKLYTWKFNNIDVARVLRQVIPRPKIVPKFGQSTERFIMIDTTQNKFGIPDTECSFSFLLSLRGSRIVDKIPAEECKHQCKALQVELKETYLLWYNWWYWRPVVQPSSSNITFIAHVGSYC